MDESNSIDEYDSENEGEDIERMIKDLVRGKSVIIGFCKRQDPDFLFRLENVANNYPKFADIVADILNQDGGEITFTKNGEQIIARVNNLEGEFLGQQIVTLEDFEKFAEMTEDFAVFLIDNGELALNIVL
jgi:hypothetical protein